MNRKLFGIRIQYILLGVIAMIMFIVIGVLYNQNTMSKWQPNEKIIGTWIGNAKINAGFKIIQDRIDIQITVYEDGTVTGTIGNAKLLGCKMSLNRNNFERFINVKTDYIISGGYLEGKIVPKDTLDYRDISMPFNIEAGTIKGSIFHVEKWKYPDPLFTHIEIKRE